MVVAGRVEGMWGDPTPGKNQILGFIVSGFLVLRVELRIFSSADSGSTGLANRAIWLT